MSKASDRAYAQIRSRILSGELAPGEQLAEEALAELCGVSRTPVRDALRRLEAELLVARNDTQRTFVADWSLDDVADAFDLRASLEGRAARLAAARMTPEVIARLRAANALVGQAIQQPVADVAAFLEGNRQFHAILLETANSRRLTALLNTLVEQPVVWRTAHFYDQASLVRSHGEHTELVAAFERRDGDWAEAIMNSHIRRAYYAYSDAHRRLTIAPPGA
ncbi:GntR family transcriptional regulator [Novosphingobium sp. FKTRR1]|uniref:GntR family transcriptional regulator n=1 Tax=unclassified Novosphingobium TaxID=2644732 RepID=UPI001CF06BD2|nr:GntR family transcriptional regulator [Novosphingobium sp. FKTRR1]